LKNENNYSRTGFKEKPSTILIRRGARLGRKTKGIMRTFIITKREDLLR
jgi:hypothetical protein